MNRIRTNIPELDSILDGGFPEASINIVTGSPGTGKTVLVQKIVYANASPERKAVYLTTLNEPMHKVLRYVQDFRFFDASKVGESVLYEDVGATFESEGLDAVMQVIHDIVVREAPAILVIDSFKALSDLAPDAATFRRALYRLTGVLTASGCTTFLIGEYDTSHLGVLPEFAIADGILELTNERRGIRTYRYLSVVKLRGSGFAPGRHAIRLSERGFEVFPRFRTPPVPREYEPSAERIPTGIPRLDALVGGGLLRGSNTLVGGPTGTGKTLFGLTFALSEIARGEPVVYATFQEDPNQIGRLAAMHGGDLETAKEQDLLRHVYVSPVELDMDRHVLRIVDAVQAIDTKSIVIDSLSDLEAAAYDAERFFDFAFSLIQYLKDRGITAVMTYDATTGFETTLPTPHGLTRLADNVILFSEAKEGQRVIREMRIVKTRGSNHDHNIHRIDIRPEGFVFAEPGALAPRR